MDNNVLEENLVGITTPWPDVEGHTILVWQTSQIQEMSHSTMNLASEFRKVRAQTSGMPTFIVHYRPEMMNKAKRT
jgi:hypothetical protein